MTEVVIVGLVSGLFGVLAAAIPAYFQQRHSPSRRVTDTASIVDASGRVITTLREEIDRLDGELADARLHITNLETHIDELEKQVRQLGGTPVRITFDRESK